MLISRRGLLFSGVAVVVAPAIVRASSLMPISVWRPKPTRSHYLVVAQESGIATLTKVDELWRAWPPDGPYHTVEGRPVLGMVTMPDPSRISLVGGMQVGDVVTFQYQA